MISRPEKIEDGVVYYFDGELWHSYTPAELVERYAVLSEAYNSLLDKIILMGK